MTSSGNSISRIFVSLTALAVLLSPFTAMGFTDGLNGPIECVQLSKSVQQTESSPVKVEQKSCCAKHRSENKNTPESDSSPCNDPVHCPCCIVAGGGLMIALPSTASKAFATETFSFVRNTSNRLTLPGWQDPLLRPPIL